MRFRSFYFRLTGKRHNLRAQNLAIPSQPAEGIDEETWLYHLHRGATTLDGSVARSRTATLPTRLSAWSKDIRCSLPSRESS